VIGDLRDLRDLIGDARARNDPAALTVGIPYATFMGISAESIDGHLRGVMAYSPHLIGNSALPALHGGTLGALLELTAMIQILWESEIVVLPKTINLTVDYLRSGKPVDTYARGVIARAGRRVANVRVEAWQEDPGRPIAAAVGNFLLQPVDS
jgi:acyl-coenzyme A thioesterase PaaI-like protein